MQHWSVDVRVDGRDVLTIESNSLAGKSEFTKAEEDAIWNAAMHLISFIGRKFTVRQLRLMACDLAEKPTQSTKHMGQQERIDGIQQMLDDLQSLAHNDGCIAAAWALEWLSEHVGKV